MRFDWRASAVAAAAALVLSLLSGIIGGVGFGALVVRGIISGVVFGAGAAGVSYVIDRYLPDLKQSMQGGGTTDGPPAGEPGSTGSQVDIVVDDEVDIDGPGASDFDLEETEEPAAPGASGGEDVEELEQDDGFGESTPSGDQTSTGTGESTSPGEGTDAAAADNAAADDAAFTPGLAAERVHAGGAEEEVAELEETGTEPNGETETPTQRDAGEGSLDGGAAPEDLEEAAPEAASTGSLPDIEGFSGDFSEAPTNDSEDEESSGDSGEDPEMMARAIRTVLKREE